VVDRFSIASAPALTAPEVARSIVAEQTRELERNEKKARRGRDPEAVHRMRVATRRLRAALRLVGSELGVRDRLERRLAWLGRKLGALRDQDVLLELVDRADLKARLPRGEAGRLDRVRRALRRRRRRAQRDLDAALGRRRWPKLLRELKEFAHKPRLLPEVNEVGQRITVRADELATAIALLPAMHDFRPSSRQLHDLRVAFKRLRYVLEVHAAMDSVAFGSELRLARALQDALGKLHDHDLLLALLEKNRGAFRGDWQALRLYLVRQRSAQLRKFRKLRSEWTERTRSAPVQTEQSRFVNLEPQSVTLRLIAGDR